jgi:hypothetical protein
VAIRRGHKNEEAWPEKVPAQAAGPKAVHHAGAKGQAEPAADKPAEAPAPAAVPAQPKVENVQDQIRRLATLRQLGVLNNEEFENLTALLLDLPRP